MSQTLEQLSSDYAKSANLLKKRIASLRAEMKKATDPEAKWMLKRRIAELTPMLEQMTDLAELTARYYEKAYYRNPKYTSNCFADIDKAPGRQAMAGVVRDNIERADGSPAGYVSDVLPAGNDLPADSGHPESKPKHREQKLEKSRSKSAAVRKVPGNGAGLMDVILNGKK